MVQDYLRPIAEISRSAYERAGSYPLMAELTRIPAAGDQPVPDLRGVPVWMLDQWPNEPPAGQ